MYWLLNDSEEDRYDDIDELVNFLVPDDAFENDNEGFDDHLNQDGSVWICSREFTRSEILYVMDQEGYCDEFASWQDSELKSCRYDVKYDIEHIEVDDWEYVEGWRIYAYMEDDEAQNEANEAVAAVVEAAEQLTIEMPPPAFDTYQVLVDMYNESERKEQEIRQHNAAMDDDLMKLLQAVH